MNAEILRARFSLALGVRPCLVLIKQVFPSAFFRVRPRFFIALHAFFPLSTF